ncbi:MAG: hypothetical protein GXP55_20455, partial [Deltaproteobacteria bacterium]|nr:hypothetical protein [Deltaproteobacteria bacterium]
MRWLREFSGASLAVLAFGLMAHAVLSLGQHAWLEAALICLLGWTALGAATELLRPSVGE